MSDTQLKGVIELSADTTKAEQDVANIPHQVEAEVKKTSQATSETVGNSIARAMGGGKESSKSFAAFLGAEVQRSLTQSLSSALGIFGEAGSAVGRSLEKSLAVAINRPLENTHSSAKGGLAIPPGSPPARGDGTHDPIPTGFLSHLGGMIDKDSGLAARVPPVAPVADQAVAGGLGASASGGLAAMAGPAGISAFITLQAAAALTMMASAVKDVVRRLMDFGRSLADVSAPMAAAFAVFDMNIMLLKKQIGDALAPAMNDLLQSVLGLAKDVLPSFILAIQGVTVCLTNAVRSVDTAMRLSGFLNVAPVYSLVKGELNKAGGKQWESPDSMRNVAQDGLYLVNRAVQYLEKILGKLPDTDAADMNKSRGLLTGLNDFLNRNDGDQAKFAAQLNRGWAAQQANGVQAVNFGLPGIGGGIH